jgi:hypothetical protein
MKGSIRAITGLLIVFGAAGGIDNATDGQLVPAFLLAISGLVLLFSGVYAMNGGKFNG